MDDYVYAKTTAMFNKARADFGKITGPSGVASLLGMYSKIGNGLKDFHQGFSIITFLRCISSDGYNCPIPSHCLEVLTCTSE